MSKVVEERYKNYLDKNFSELSKNNYKRVKKLKVDEQKELIAYNNIFGFLIGAIDAKGQTKELEECRKYVLDDYEKLELANQLDVINEVIYSNDTFNNLGLVINDLKTNNYEQPIQVDFITAYLNGYRVGKSITLKEILPFYKTRIINHLNQKEIVKEKTKKL